MQRSVLIYGSDLRLLEIRQMVLECAGYRVCRAADLASVIQVSLREPIDLLLLCHTLSEEDCGRAIAFVNKQHPQVQTIALTAGSKGCAFAHVNEVVAAIEGPQKLLNTISRLIPSEPAQSPPHQHMTSQGELQWLNTAER